MRIQKEMLENKIGVDMSWDFRKSVKFTKIDRKEESGRVLEFQETEDMDLFEKIYLDRVSTLQIWARRYAYLMNDFDDMYEEFALHFIKAVYGFKKGHASFNTFLFTSLLNCKRNLRSSQNAKKRRPKEIEDNGINNFVLSLDYNYNKTDGSEATLKDVIADNLHQKEETIDKMCLDETIRILSNENPLMQLFLTKLGNGNTVASLIKELKIKRGRINLNKEESKKLNTNKKCNKIVSNLIKDKGKLDEDFQLVNYHIADPNKLNYTVEMKKTKESDYIMKSIRRLKKDKNHILQQIKG